MSPRVETRDSRKRRDALKRAGIWIFLIIFAFSVVGGALVAVGGFGQ
jgi:hypothetical protein